MQGQPLYNHALALRHTIDKGQRILRDFVATDLPMPRWGSNSYTPAPRFDELIRDRYTSESDWRELSAAAQLEADGNQWWKDRSKLNLNNYGSVKSADAARFWFRAMVRALFSS